MDLFNIPFNSLSVICQGANTRQMIEDKDINNLCYLLMKEVQSLAKAENHTIDDKSITDMIERTRKMKPYKTSMLLDFESKKTMEVEAILGEPIKIAKANNIKVPFMYSIYSILSFLNSG